MPVICAAPGTVRGTITQVAGQDPDGGGPSAGLFRPMSTDPAVSLPASTSTFPCGQSNSYTRQMIAYIPDTDLYGNSTHGVVATAMTGTASGGMVSRDNWLFQVNSGCDSGGVCKPMGDFWSNHSSTGSGSNFFPAGSPYAGRLRNDQPNTICVASMNTAMAEAYKIRSDATYHVVINTIYLTGNGGDAVDREFLPIIANVQSIPPLPYQPAGTPSYLNPAFQPNQEHGQYLVTNNASDLPSLFQQLASQVLRLSN